MMTKIYCPKCKRYLFETDTTAIISHLKCAGCKKWVNIKFVTPDSSEKEIKYKFAQSTETKTQQTIRKPPLPHEVVFCCANRGLLTIYLAFNAYLGERDIKQ